MTDIILLEINELKDILAPAFVALFNLHLKFQHNSFLHYMIDQIFKMLFNKSYNETTGYKDVFQFRLRVINECDLLNSLVSES